MPTEQIDPAICPLCGADNRCAVERGDSIETCWCASTPISEQALQAIPPALRNRACLCAQCAKNGATNSNTVSLWSNE